MNNYSTNAHKPRKRFGQNFLRDQTVLARIIEFIRPNHSEHFLEIGAGEGALTIHLLPLIDRLDAIELDRDLIPVLQVNCKQYSEKLFIQQIDILKLDFFSLVDKKGGKLRVVGNLPYNISTPLLFYTLNYVSIINDMHFMLQREVAERLCASYGSKTYGRLSIIMQYFYEIELLLAVSKTAFYPVPKVDSGFVCFRPRCYHAVEAKDINRFFEVVKVAFTHRRKTLRNCLAGIVSESQLLELEISSNLRPEQLTVDDFVRISNLS